MAGIVGSLKALGKAVASSITTTKAKKNTDKKVDVGFNTRKSSDGKKISPRSRSGIINQMTQYVKASLPRPQAGKLVSRDQSEVNKKRISAGFNNANFSNMKLKLLKEEELEKKFPFLPIISSPVVFFAQIYTGAMEGFPDEDIQKVYLETNNYFICVPEISCRDYMYSMEKFRKGEGVGVCCPKCNTNKFVKFTSYRIHTFLIYDINDVFNCIVANYSCSNKECTVKITNAVFRHGEPYIFNSEDVKEQFPTINFMKRNKCSVTKSLVRKCFSCNGPSQLVKDVDMMYQRTFEQRKRGCLKYMLKKKRESQNINYIEQLTSINKPVFTTAIAKMVFNESFLNYEDNICQFFQETPITYSLHGDGTYQIVLSTNATKCCLYILCNSYRQIIGYFVIKTESGANLKPALIWIHKKSDVKIECVFFDDTRLFSICKEIFGNDVYTCLDIFHVEQRILKCLRGNQIDAHIVRERLHKVIYGDLPSYKECESICLAAKSEEGIKLMHNNTAGDICQLMFALVLQLVTMMHTQIMYRKVIIVNLYVLLHKPKK